MRILFCLIFSAAVLRRSNPRSPTRLRDAELRQIQAKTAELGAMLNAVGSHPLYADAAIYHKAADSS